MSDQTKREISAAFRQKGFLVAFVIFLLAAVGLNAAINFGGLEFRKERVELQRDLNTIPEALGPWQMLNDERMSEEVEHALGTKVYIQRQYVDTRIVPKAQVEAARKLTDERARRMAIHEMMVKYPKAVISFHIPYYTGMADTVAHVPERCYVANGQDPENPDTVRMPVFKGVANRKPDLQVRYVEFRDRDRTTSSVSNVMYVFQVNGAYESDSLGGVRARMQDIFQKYVYYAKIELMLHMPDDAKGAQAVMADFLTYAMPEVEKCLPDWKAVTGQVPDLNNHY
jgi:hypothetical protein